MPKVNSIKVVASATRYLCLNASKICGLGLLGFIILWCYFRINYAATTSVVSSNSMAPTFQIGDRYFTNKNLESADLNDENIERYIKRGMFVGVINRHVTPAERSGKRVVGFPNDVIEMKNGMLYLNGVRATMDVVDSVNGTIFMREKIGDIEYYVQYKQDVHDNIRKFLRNGKWVVPKNKVFVIGDNRDESADSRLHGVSNGGFGFINIDDLVTTNKMTSISVSNTTKLQFDRIGCPVHSTQDYMPLDRTCWMRDSKESITGYVMDMLGNGI